VLAGLLFAQPPAAWAQRAAPGAGNFAPVPARHLTSSSPNLRAPEGTVVDGRRPEAKTLLPFTTGRITVLSLILHRRVATAGLAPLASHLRRSLEERNRRDRPWSFGGGLALRFASPELPRKSGPRDPPRRSIRAYEARLPRPLSAGLPWQLFSFLYFFFLTTSLYDTAELRSACCSNGFRAGTGLLRPSDSPPRPPAGRLPQCSRCSSIDGRGSVREILQRPRSCSAQMFLTTKSRALLLEEGCGGLNQVTARLPAGGQSIGAFGAEGPSYGPSAPEHPDAPVLSLLAPKCRSAVIVFRTIGSVRPADFSLRPESVNNGDAAATQVPQAPTLLPPRARWESCRLSRALPRACRYSPRNPDGADAQVGVVQQKQQNNKEQPQTPRITWGPASRTEKGPRIFRSPRRARTAPPSHLR